MGETPLNVGYDLYELSKGGLAEKPDKKKSLWLITDRGREALENPPSNWGRNLTEDTQEETSEGNLGRKPRGETQRETRGNLGGRLGETSEGKLLRKPPGNLREISEQRNSPMVNDMVNLR